MLFPFRASAIFRNRWVALLWAVGICFMASEIVDSLSGVTDRQQGTTSQKPADGVTAVENTARQPIADPVPDRIVK